LIDGLFESVSGGQLSLANSNAAAIVKDNPHITEEFKRFVVNCECNK